MTTEALVLWCTTCQDDVAFEQPGCDDGHGRDCTDWACVQCGDALFVGFVADLAHRSDLSVPAVAVHPTSHPTSHVA
jgi:hypothetical protein